jgi:tetratricopeptide (TPR) repeat protein
VSIAKEISLENRFEHMGAEIIKEVATKTNDSAGDGTTTSVIIAQALINEGFKHTAMGANSMAIKVGIEKAGKDAVEYIKKSATPIKDKKAKLKVTKASSSASDVHPLAPLVALVCVLLAIGFTVKPLIAQKSFAFAFYLGTDPSIPETLSNKVDALIKAENQDSGNVTWPRYSANSLFIDKAWKETIEAAERAITKDPEDWVSWWFMASAYEQSGQRVKAIPSRLKTVELDPWNTSVLLELAKNQLAAGDAAGFEESKKNILRISPNGSDAQAVSSL